MFINIMYVLDHGEWMTTKVVNKAAISGTQISRKIVVHQGATSDVVLRAKFGSSIWNKCCNKQKTAKSLK